MDDDGNYQKLHDDNRKNMKERNESPTMVNKWRQEIRRENVKKTHLNQD